MAEGDVCSSMARVSVRFRARSVHEGERAGYGLDTPLRLSVGHLTVTIDAAGLGP
jgi:hypothetical protein